MPLTPGTRLGPFEIASSLGAGGMGEVYRARDTKLGRDVALKILPATFLHDPERLARFRREAQVLASLNHPNIAGIYGLEESGSQTALVLELVEGATLADRLAARTPEAESGGSRPRDSKAPPARGGGAPRGLEIDDALAIARQIVAALEEAHGRGIVHRDLKPANISVRDDATVKVLDFGLAKLADPMAAGSTNAAANLANSPTVTTPAMTALGTILGTAAYMSPEQAKGRAVDKRADIWAFGCVLYEMLTGRRAFEGDDVTDTMAAILRGDPDWTALPANLPAPIARLLRRCLVKEPARRLPDIGAARFELDDALSPPAGERAPAATPVAAPPRPVRRWPERVALAIVALALVGLAGWHFAERPAPRPTYRFQLTPPADTLFAGGFSGASAVVSPDGRFVVHRAFRTGGAVMLWLRDLQTMETRELAGTEAANSPFWSPDSRSIAFFADRKLKRVDVTGGTPQTLADLGPGIGGGSWSPDGSTILFNGGPQAGLQRVPATGGQPVLVTTIDTAAKEIAHILPTFLPDGRRFLYRVIPAGAYLASLDNAERTRILDFDSSALYAPPGYLLFVRQDRLLAQRFDLSTGRLSGDPTPVAANVSAQAIFAVSPAGVLVYQTGSAQVGGTPAWIDRTGRQVGEIGIGKGVVQFPRLSPDGQRLAVVADGDIWVHDLGGRPPIRLTFGGRESPAFSPLWTPDGRHLVYEMGSASAVPGLYSLPADGSERTAARVSPEGHFHPHGWFRDGRELLAVEVTTTATPDIVAITMSEPFAKRPVVETPGTEGMGGAAVSPDGRWLAYVTDSTGASEIWVRPFPGPGVAVRISPEGGVEPVWSRSGRELFYRLGGRLMAVPVQAGSEFQFSKPTVLFDGQFEYTRPGNQPPSYDVAPDGRFLLLKPPVAIQSQPITVVVNWAEELERRVRP
jgi:Tol biopolymer transport system component/tRNA A-37 threonylcarbamoyl transferase component Bud32